MMDTTDTSTQTPAANEGNKRTVLITIVIALVLIGALWVWKSIEIGHLKEQAATENQALKKAADEKIVQVHSDHLKLLAKPFVWALRTEMLQGNLNQVNLYMSDLVKEKNIQRVVIANNKGIIVASTNKKDEGQQFATIGKAAAAATDETSIEAAGHVLTMTSPVMGFNNRLGTLLIRYAVPDTALN
ncbi:hypothetical protein EOD41_16710 [Mucilaginibacter limnophilus]|uniref:Uncharacterized protein n=1 Tax=Mucilaginibacter limnophilus TaxID=1932778 RepID=A0A3S2Y1K5_9SPHI|nr:hypothetical protein [Mucilaginibacter limnophilus]RVT98432.1 hypothetical protein EOD41_16710 [Mucilaginibacter limnophilus]